MIKFRGWHLIQLSKYEIAKCRVTWRELCIPWYASPLDHHSCSMSNPPVGQPVNLVSSFSLHGAVPGAVPQYRRVPGTIGDMADIPGDSCFWPRVLLDPYAYLMQRQHRDRFQSLFSSSSLSVNHVKPSVLGTSERTSNDVGYVLSHTLWSSSAWEAICDPYQFINFTP